MSAVKKIHIKPVLIASVMLCGIGFYLISNSNDTQEDATLLSLKKNNSAEEQKTQSSLSTSELIAESAQKVLAQAENQPREYPNITPKKLVKPFSPTLEGTDIDGQLKVGEDGKLVMNIDVKDFFDYFLSTTAEVSPETALSEMLKVAHDSLPPDVFLEVQAMLDNYLAYKEAAISYMSQPMLPHDQQTIAYQQQVMEEAISALRALRREHMPENQVEAFFGLEEAYEDYTLASIKIQNNPDLSAEAQQQQLKAQRALLPPEIRNTEEQLISDMETSKEVNELLLSDKPNSEIEANLRDLGMDETGIQDALQYRQQQQEFEEKYALYKKERDQLLSARLSEEDLIQQKERLLEKYFQTEESMTQARVKDLSS